LETTTNVAHVIVNRARCKGCELCMQVCPKKILRRGTTLNERGVYAIEPSDADACIGCLQCVLVCPDVAITITDDDVSAMEEGKP